MKSLTDFIIKIKLYNINWIIDSFKIAGLHDWHSLFAVWHDCPVENEWFATALIQFGRLAVLLLSRLASYIMNILPPALFLSLYSQLIVIVSIKNPLRILLISKFDSRQWLLSGIILA